VPRSAPTLLAEVRVALPE